MSPAAAIPLSGWRARGAFGGGLLAGWVWLAMAGQAFALGQASYVTDAAGAGDFTVCAAGPVATVAVDTNDFPGVVRAARDLGSDLTRVTGRTPAIRLGEPVAGTNVILVGTLGRSAIIKRLVQAGKVDVAGVAGKWETFFVQVAPHPWPGIDQALVICGSDPRGTIYGVYDLSEQMGVSPWYFFADVPVPHRDRIFVTAGRHAQGPPAVKYRGIFLNDEAPDLTGWVRERYGDYNHGFYTNVFELLLRLKANYLWPAMWDNCFNEDDPQNYQLANEYGIVMGTSHVEPMMRADKEWNRLGYAQRDWNFQTHSNELSAFWRAGVERNRNCENIITIAMRGKIDTPMSETANIALLEQIVAAQRRIIADVYHTNAAAVPQLWALYKEVLEYYEKGMRVPDDVTLLWCDDNWGNLRRLPSPEDRRRAGGSGIYYHFDYVGGPRNYKWINTISLPRTWEQMQLAHACGANQIWIVNVGHLQHVPLPTEFFLSLAWNPDRWDRESIPEFLRLWAEREFGPTVAPQVAQVMADYGRAVSRRKPELLGPDTFSVINYQEAGRILAEWDGIANAAGAVVPRLPTNAAAAYFEEVLYPVMAGNNLNQLYAAVARNHWYAAQGRAGANGAAAEARRHFATDAALTEHYNRHLAGGKWHHMMDQTHIGYSSWQQPEVNIMPAVQELTVPAAPAMGVAVEGSTNAWPGPGAAALPEFDRFSKTPRYVDVFNRGGTAFEFAATSNVPWVSITPSSGPIQSEQRVWINVDWALAPAGRTSAGVTVAGAGNSVTVTVNTFNPREPALDSFTGFVESGGCVSMEAEHFTAKVDTAVARWDRIEGLGNTLSGMTLFPMTAPSVLPPRPAPCLEYKMYLFHAGPVMVETRLAPTLNFRAGQGLRFALSFDDAPPQVVTAVPADYTAGDANHDWEETVSDNVRKVRTPFDLATPGAHTLKFWMVDPGVVLERLIVDCGGVRPSYLGPPESPRRESAGK